MKMTMILCFIVFCFFGEDEIEQRLIFSFSQFAASKYSLYIMPNFKLSIRFTKKIFNQINDHVPHENLTYL